MKKSAHYFLTILIIVSSFISCQNDDNDYMENPTSKNSIPSNPENPYLINSPWPAVHGGSYRQGYTTESGLREGDIIKTSFTRTPNDKVSPWLLYSEQYPDGNYTFWGSTSTHIFKGISNKGEFKVVSDHRIDYNPMINDLSWSFLMLENHQVLTYDDNTLFLFGEEDSSDPYSDIVLIKKIGFSSQISTISKLCRLYDGNIAFASENGLIGIIDSKSFSLLTTYQIPLANGEEAYHNDYAVDEKGNIYISTTEKMLSVNWDGKDIKPNWEVFMDFGGNRFQGIGTTPTLFGVDDEDKLVSVVDSQNPPRMLTFWREEIPSDWKGIDGYDKRLAAAIELPGATIPNMINTAVENSPTAYGYDIACAQYNGLQGQPCNNYKGIYKLRWNPDANTMKIVWQRDDINMNSILVYSTATNYLYGSGKENDCNYYYYTLDWETGTTIRRDILGNSEQFDDPGNTNLIGPDRSIIYNSKEGLVRIRPQ